MCQILRKPCFEALQRQRKLITANWISAILSDGRSYRKVIDYQFKIVTEIVIFYIWQDMTWGHLDNSYLNWEV